MSKLVIGPEGFVDLRRNPPATSVTVQGFTAEDEGPRRLPVETLPEPPAEPKDEALPGRQKTTEGLEVSVAGPVKVRAKRTSEVRRIEASDGSGCYAIVTRNAFNRLSRHKYFGTRGGHLYRKVKNKWSGIEEIIWLHREIKHLNLANKYIAFLDGDQRNLLPSNTKIVNSKEEVRAIRHAALQNSAGRTKPVQ